MTSKELRAKKQQEVHAFIKKWGSELALLKIRTAAGQNQKTSEIERLRRSIARAKTILKEKA